MEKLADAPAPVESEDPKQIRFGLQLMLGERLYLVRKYSAEIEELIAKLHELDVKAANPQT